VHLEIVLVFLNVAWSHLVPSSIYVLIVIYNLLYKLFKSQTDTGGKRASPDLKRTEISESLSLPWLTKGWGLAPVPSEPERLQLCGVLALEHEATRRTLLLGPGARSRLEPGKPPTSAGEPAPHGRSGSPRHKEVN